MACGLAVVVLGLAVSGAGGCTFKGGNGLGTPLGLGGAWTPRPVSMRVHPSTRFVKREGDPVLEARVELLDEMGDATKASGEFRMELYAGTTPGGEAPARRQYAWTVTLTTLADHERAFDPITRSYRFNLKLDDMSIARRRSRLVVTLTPADDGPRLTAEAEVRTDW